MQLLGVFDLICSRASFGQVCLSISQLHCKESCATSIGPQPYSLAFEPWPEQLKYRFDLWLLVQTEGLSFFEASLLKIQRVATSLSPIICIC